MKADGFCSGVEAIVVLGCPKVNGWPKPGDEVKTNGLCSAAEAVVVVGCPKINGWPNPGNDGEAADVCAVGGAVIAEGWPKPVKVVGVVIFCSMACDEVVEG